MTSGPTVTEGTTKWSAEILRLKDISIHTPRQSCQATPQRSDRADKSPPKASSERERSPRGTTVHLKEELQAANLAARHAKEHGLLEGHLQGIRENQEVKELRRRIGLSERQVEHVLTNHYEVTAADRRRLWGLENVVEECVAKVQNMYQQRDELSAEAKAESNDLKRRISLSETQVARVFQKYQQLSVDDRHEYLMLEQRCVTCKAEHAEMFQVNQGRFAQSLAHEEKSQHYEVRLHATESRLEQHVQTMNSTLNNARAMVDRKLRRSPELSRHNKLRMRAMFA